MLSHGGVIGAAGISGSPAWPEIQDDFSGTLSNWTQLSANAMVISSGVLTGPYSDETAGCIYNTATSTTTQAIEFKLANRSSIQGVILWASDASSSANYVFLRGFDDSGGQNYGLYTVVSGTPTQVGGDPTYTSVVNNYYGVKITGPANSATVVVYNNGTSSGGSPSGWTNAVVTFSSVNLSAVTPGGYVGFRIQEAPGAFDNFKAGIQ